MLQWCMLLRSRPWPFDNMCTLSHTHIHTQHTHTYTHAYTHIHKHTHLHTHTHTHTHTQTHIHTYTHTTHNLTGLHSAWSCAGWRLLGRVQSCYATTMHGSSWAWLPLRCWMWRWPLQVHWCVCDWVLVLACFWVCWCTSTDGCEDGHCWRVHVWRVGGRVGMQGWLCGYLCVCACACISTWMYVTSSETVPVRDFGWNWATHIEPKLGMALRGRNERCQQLLTIPCRTCVMSLAKHAGV